MSKLSVIPVAVVIPGLSGGRDISRQGEVAWWLQSVASQHSLQYKVTLNTHSQTRETRDSHERNCSPPGRAMRQPDWIKGMKGIITLKRSHPSALTETNGNGDGRDSINFPLSVFSMLINVMVVGWVAGLPVTNWKIPHFRWIWFYWRDVTLSIITRPTDSLWKFDETKIKGID